MKKVLLMIVLLLVVTGLVSAQNETVDYSSISDMLEGESEGEIDESIDNSTLNETETIDTIDNATDDPVNATAEKDDAHILNAIMLTLGLILLILVVIYFITKLTKGKDIPLIPVPESEVSIIELPPDEVVVSTGTPVKDTVEAKE